MASPVDTSVKFFRDNFPGAPSLNGLAGGGLGVLDGCLVNGFGLRSVTSLVVSGGVATATLSTDALNPNLLHSVILVDGVTGSLTALNGEQRVTAATTTTLAFATEAADGTATGTITVKTAPAGWGKPFSGTNLAVYRSADVTGTRMYLRVSDTATLNFRVRGFTTMSDVSTGTGAFPTTGQSSGGGYWAKSYEANSTIVKWDLFADSRGFYYCPLIYSGIDASTAGQGAYWFGDLLNFKSPDPFCCELNSSTAAPGNTAAYGSIFYLTSDPGSSTMRSMPRSYTGLGSAIYMQTQSESGASGAYSGYDGDMGVFPAPADGGLRLSRIYTTETAQSGVSAILRAFRPGVYHCPQTGLYQYFQRGDYVTASASPISDRLLAVVFAGSTFSSPETDASGGRGFIDITGPWR